MRLNKPIFASIYSSQDTTKLILRGSLIIISFLTLHLLVYHLAADSLWLNTYPWIIIATVFYLLVGEYLIRKNHYQTVNWMLILLFEVLAFFTLIVWGLNAPVGILTISFAVLLPSVLMGPRAILLVIIFTITILVAVQTVHASGISSPNLRLLAEPSGISDIITYSIILSIFALVSWISSTQRERSLSRALEAEARLNIQKNTLKKELEKESATLRLAQLNQIRELHKFAFLGQAAAATLHELSNHLSILNIDIDDLSRHAESSKAMNNAKGSIEHINKMVRKVKHQINSYDRRETFDAVSIITQSLNDMKTKFVDRKIEVKFTQNKKKPFRVTGDPMALMQIITIILNNAIDACYDSPNPKVTVEIKLEKILTISITDTGHGIEPTLRKQLFTPVISTKPTGMGIGLYIAHHLIQNQFNGDIEVPHSEYGATFVIKIPK